ncbi:MAG: choice-of-anchor D domain-containing protein [Chlorobi bacterium CHB2]|nr:choice-of-anchor D domain-containing protein [Chlorobi bacterium CHB2]
MILLHHLRFFRAWRLLLLCMVAYGAAAQGDGKQGGMAFIANRGQWDGAVRFLLDKPGQRVWFADREVVYDLANHRGDRHILRQRFVGAAGVASGHRLLPGRWNFFTTAAPFTSVPAFAEVHYSAIAPGISGRFYQAAQGELKYDLILQPGALPAKLRYFYDGAESLRIAADGALVVGTSVGELREAAPVCWQQLPNGTRRYVAARFVLEDGGVGFRLGTYDPTQPLIIDPSVKFSSYIGGAGAEQGRGVAVDTLGNIVVAGSTRSQDFPTTAGAIRRTISDPITLAPDIFIAKLDPTGSTLIYGTYIGGRGDDEPTAIRLTRRGDAIVAGATTSDNFFTPGALQTVRGGGMDGFILSLSPRGNALNFITYVGGKLNERVEDIRLDGAGNIYFAGWTSSNDFPVTFGSLSTTQQGGEDAIVGKMNANGASLMYSTYVGGSGDERATGIVAEPGGAVWITGWTSSDNFPTSANAVAQALAGGHDAFLARIDFTGTKLLYGTFLGGSNQDHATAIALDSLQAPYITGVTVSGDYPTTIPTPSGAWFVTRLDTLTGKIAWSRYIGPNDAGVPATIQVDEQRNTFLAGTTDNLPGNPFPISADAPAQQFRGGKEIAMVQLSSDGSTIRHAVVAGGARDDSPARVSHLNRYGDLLITGTTQSANFPVTRFALDRTLNDGTSQATDAFLLRYGFQRRPHAIAQLPRSMDTLRCETSRLDTFFIYNSGESDLVIDRNIFKVSSQPNPTFALVRIGNFPVAGVVRNPPDTIRPKDSLRYIVQFESASQQNTFHDTLLVFTTDSVQGNPLRIPFTAVRSAPGVAALPASLGFRVVLPCRAGGADTSITIFNNGSGSVRITGIELLAGTEYSLLNKPTFPKSLKELEQLLPLLRVRFNPTTSGTFRDTVLVQLAECGGTLRIPIEGVADTVRLRSVPSVVEFPQVSFCGTQSDTSITLFNDGTTPITIASASALADFQILNPPPLTIPPAGNVTLRLRFRPNAGTSDATEILQLLGGPCGVSATVELRGKRLGRGGLRAPADTIRIPTFAACAGDTVLRDTLVTLRSLAAGMLVAANPTLSNPQFSIVDPANFPISVLPGGDLPLRIRYRSVASGSNLLTLAIPFDADGCADTLRLVVVANRVDLQLSAAPAQVDMGSLLQCTSFIDTVITFVNNSLGVVRVDSVGATLGLAHLRPFLPFDIPAGGTRQVTVRFTPQKTGENVDSLRYYVDGCSTPIVVEVRGVKTGFILSFAQSKVALGPLLRCAIPGTFTIPAILRNRGNSPTPARVVAVVRVAGDAAFSASPASIGMAIPSGDSITLPIQFTPAAPGDASAQFAVVLAPCNDTLLLDVSARIVAPTLAASGGDFGAVPVRTAVRATLTLTNTTELPLQLDSLGGLPGAFRVVSAQPPLPRMLQPGDSVVMELEFAPDAPGSYQITPLAMLSNPCRDSVPVSLLGVGIELGDQVQFCIGGRTRAIAGDTVEVILQSLNPLQLSSPTDLEWQVRYPVTMLQFLQALPAGLQAVADGSGRLQLRLQGATAVPTPVARLKFLALAGGNGDAVVKIDSAASTAPLLVPTICADSAVVQIGSRCVLTSIGLGKHRNALNDPVPNPANGIVAIGFQQLEDARTTIRLFDAQGRQVLMPLQQELRGGQYSLLLDLSDLPDGAYFYTIEAGQYHQSKRIVIQR